MNFKTLTAVFLICSSAAAEPPGIQTIPPGDDKIVSVKEGEKVPFSGQLFDPSTSLRWANWLEQYRFRLKTDVETVQAMGDIRYNYALRLVDIEKERSGKVEKDLQTRLARSEQARLAAEEEARNPPWYKTREFGLVLGVLGTAAAVGLSVYIIDSAKQ